MRNLIRRAGMALAFSASIVAAGAGIGVAEAVAAPLPASVCFGTNRVGIDAYVTADQRASDRSLSTAERVAALEARALWARELTGQELAIAKCRR